jgi:hypothetical protein
LTLIDNGSEIAQDLYKVDKKFVDRILFLREECIKVEELLKVMEKSGLIRNYKFKSEKEELLKKEKIQARSLEFKR